MKLILYPEDTGLRNYENTKDCPIARSLIRAGYTKVRVTPCVWTANDPDGIMVAGCISRELDNLAQLWGGKNKITKPLIFEL